MQIIIAILVINLFVLLLCALLALSDRFFNRAGQVELRVNEQKCLEVSCGQSLYAALTQADVFLPAACGGKGTCGRCQVTVKSGGGPLMPLEQLNLSAGQLAEAWRLACQVKVRQPISLEVADSLLNARSYTVELLSSEPVAEDIRTLTFGLRAGDSLVFKPGQYLQVFYQLPWEKVIRAYSLASDSELLTSFSFDVQRVEGGLVSNYLHQLQIGCQIEVCGPFGDMYFTAADHDGPVVLVAGGVGLAPMRAIIACLLRQDFAQPVYLFHGVRSRKNLYGEQDFRELDKKFGNFHYIPALSNPMIEEGWVGARGMIHETIAQQLPSIAFVSAFVCGPAPMMQAVTKVLVAKGLPSDRIFTDPFDF